MPNFTNETIDLDQLPKYEETPLTSPDPKYWNVCVISISIFLLFIAIGLSLLLWLNDEVKHYTYLILVVFLGFSLLLFLLQWASFKKKGFALREKDMIYKSGIIAIKTSIVPLNRIQHVALDEGIFSRMYGLATLQLNTAGGSSGQIHIEGIPVEKAKIIKELLIKKIDLLESSANA